ncbi:histidine phosphatase family protein [Paenalcaligenes niemegkensis]|uniref:SixA phosphatase family protein n=1 Tax=Paenalcaligenes niemegkensis TaxID=2895469 RepID=UPI001EE8CFE5|nr:histidine phosphatase family protein [Paenalcaligenes niemegkensis]MCQ9618092.1 histidine phosphatase family protein [Paenalcaligenes niemegkensis]
MRRLILLRHAKADRPNAVSDHERPLAKSGRSQSTVMGEYMAKEGLVPDLAIVSTSRRTQETWQLVQPAFASHIDQRNDPRIYEASVDDICQAIKETEASVHVLLLIGHNPGFEHLAQTLIETGRPSVLSRFQLGYPTAGLAVIDLPIESWSEAGARIGHLERFETPDSVNS